MKKEYVIWGIPKGKVHEDVLYTRAKTLIEAKKVMKIIEKEYGAKKCHIEILDFKTMPDFTKTLNI